MVLSWYEQKAVCILLTLLHLGIQGIRLRPTLPAFLSPNVLNFLAEHYAIAPTTTPEADLAAPSFPKPHCTLQGRTTLSAQRPLLGRGAVCVSRADWEASISSPP